MANRFARPNRFLQKLFPSSDKTTPVPSELSGTVNLVHPYPGRALEAMESVVLTSNTAVTPDAALIDMTVPGFLGKAGEGDWIELIAADIGHDSATSRVVTLFYQTPQNTEVIIGRWDSFANSGAVLAGAVSGFEPVFLSSGGPQANIRAPLRPIVVPQGWRLRVRGDTAAVAYTITVHGALIVHSQSDVPAIY